MNTYSYFTDGAATMAKENGKYLRKEGGWAFICFKNGQRLSNQSGGCKLTTNNEMELYAIYAAMRDFLQSCVNEDNVEIYPIGRKVAEKARKLGYNIKCDLTELVDHPNVKQCIDLAMELGDRFAKGEIDKVELIYHHFKSAGSQILTHKTFLPIDIESELNADHERDLSSNVVTKQVQDYLKKNNRKKEAKENEVKPLNDNFIVEPDMHTVLSQLIPKMGHLMLYTALLDSVASEHAARMVAMQTATDNADELLRQLNLQYNKSRQQAITNELLDIVGGSVNN